MARIYVTEPGAEGGVGAMGATILIGALRDAGHDVMRLRLDGDDATPSLFGAHDRAASAAGLARPDAWFVSSLYPRQWLRLRQLFARMGLPMLTDARRDSDPLVVMGGQAAIAPAPLLPLFDAIALGDGEVTGLDAAALLDLHGGSRRAVMDALAGRRGWMVHSADPHGMLVRVEAGRVTPRIMSSPRGAASAIEIARGCASKCAFCPIGWAGGTYREAPREDVERLIASAPPGAMNLYAPDYSSVSWARDAEAALDRQGCRPIGRDARLDRTYDLLAIDHGAARAYSFGIEGASERLRVALSKPLPDDQIVEVMGALGRAGVGVVRWYLILGLPGETDEDLAAILTLLDRVRGIYGRRLELTLTMFQPVPHTPLGGEDAHWSESGYARAMAIRAWCRDAGPAPGGALWMASQPKGRELAEHDAWLQRAPIDAVEYITSQPATRGTSEAGRESSISSGRWRAGRTIDPHLEPIPPDAITPWSFVDVGVPAAALNAARRTYWSRLDRPPTSARTVEPLPVESRATPPIGGIQRLLW